MAPAKWTIIRTRHRRPASDIEDVLWTRTVEFAATAAPGYLFHVTGKAGGTDGDCSTSILRYVGSSVGDHDDSDLAAMA